MPPPKAGRGVEFLLLRVLLPMLRPTVASCWLRAVAILLSTVGCLSSSLDVGMRLMLTPLLSSPLLAAAAAAATARLRAPSLDDVDTDDADMTRSTSLLARRGPWLGLKGALGLVGSLRCASVSARMSSRSTSSISSLSFFYALFSWAANQIFARYDVDDVGGVISMRSS